MRHTGRDPGSVVIAAAVPSQRGAIEAAIEAKYAITRAKE
jgi:hypothetical protein